MSSEDLSQDFGSLEAAVLEALPDGVLLYDSDGRCLLANSSAARLLDVSRSQLHADGWAALRLDERSDLEKKLICALRAGRPGLWEGPFLCAKGRTRWLRFGLQPVGEPGSLGVLVAVSDISDRREAESLLRLTQASVDRCTDPIYWLSPEGRVLFVNETGCRRYGYTKEEMLALTVLDIAPFTTPELWRARWTKIKQAKSLILETLHVTKAGELFPVEIRANYVAHEGREYSVSFVRDISERKRQEEELLEAKRALEATNNMLKRAVRRAQRLNQQLRAAQKILEQQATSDPLTGTCNRRAVLERLDAELIRSERTGLPCGLGLVDVDHFKKLNDSYGHLAGDEVLREVAGRIAATLRPYDVVGRYGGEEFLLLLSGADSEEVYAILERVRRAVSDCPVQTEGQELWVTVSAGGASGRRGPARDLIRAADQALYEAKRTKRNRVVVAAGTGQEKVGGAQAACSA